MVVARSVSRGFVRRLSGVLVGGLVALTLVLLAGWLYADRTGLPGPGTEMLVAHGVAAVVAIAAQVWVDRRIDVLGTAVAAGLGALVVVWLSVAWLV
jgi:hypothetical protein